jgi:hypothetical protein
MMRRGRARGSAVESESDGYVNWDAIGAIGEAVGAAAVVASLLYLAIQVRGSIRASAVEAKLESTRLLNHFIDLLIENPELNDLFMRGIDDLDQLSKEEYYRFSNMSLKAFWFFSASHFQFKMGTLAEDDFHESRSVLRYWLRRPGCRAWWERLGKDSVSPTFRDFVDSEIAELLATQSE